MNETSASQIEDLDEEVVPAADEVVVRTASSKEISEVVKPSWLTSYTRSVVARWMRADSRHAAGRDRYWASMQARVERVISTSTTSVRVAWIPPSPGEDGDGIVAGWVCDDQRNRTLHYAYVRENFRRQGIGKRLYGWINEDPNELVYMLFLPPPWFTKPDEQTGKLLWRHNHILDLITTA
jgi:GNAT superfamily N-acetyltransferase